MTKPNFQAAKVYVLQRLETELNSNLHYHGIHHTRDDVMPAAKKLGKLERICKKDQLLLNTSALYHDIGYIEKHEQNEAIAVRIANQTLPGFGYSNAQIQRIGKIIMATQLKVIDGKYVQDPNPNDILQQLICDADLDSLGREDFFRVGETLRLELIEYGMPKTPIEWLGCQLEFQQNHSYFTNAARNLRNDGKEKNIKRIKEILGIE
jgi:uncharacterized protein